VSTLALFSGAPVENVDSTDAQCTPRDLALELGVWGIDPCTNPRSHVQALVKCMLERGEDGLAHSWCDERGVPWSAFVNGPYSEPLPWCQRLRAHDAPWCSLWKLDTTTEWFRQLLAPGPRGQLASWAPFRARLRFERPGNCGAADFTSVLVWRDWTPPDAVKARLWMPVERVS
jgi:hypothetical protein